MQNGYGDADVVANEYTSPVWLCADCGVCWSLCRMHRPDLEVEDVCVSMRPHHPTGPVSSPIRIEGPFYPTTCPGAPPSAGNGASFAPPFPALSFHLSLPCSSRL